MRRIVQLLAAVAAAFVLDGTVSLVLHSRRRAGIDYALAIALTLGMVYAWQNRRHTDK